ncbi:zinc finger FYVE domain-containing protein 9-like isoform X3 [Salvelinus fontinalis]|uniref:zinc finger FYVE domain-containing protein 9-like isoform X3 n=1 Tax=Salvelinus fontinalis TaxID=8038 RepID=UPI0024851A21|nr:zinc finger FYVE domain-containing protein 9-like isoform X3 [Salvelinus fontinalis]
MENYFQAEAFNLDKVLDDFEQKQDETDSPSLSDKWIQILAPPAHLLSPNRALALTPDLGPLTLKTPPPPDPSSSDPQGPDAKRHPAAELPLWGEELPDCRADVQSPPLPQPNIGKLVGGEEGSSPPVSASSSPPPYQHHSSISPSSPASPALNGLSEDPCKGNQTWVTPLPPTPSDPRTDASVGERGDGSSHVSHTHLTIEERLGRVEAMAEKVNSKPETERAGAWSPIQDSGGEEAGMAGVQSHEEGIPYRESHGNTVKNGLMEGPTERKECRNSSQKQKRLMGEMEKESRGSQDGERVLTSAMATEEEEDRGSREEKEEDRGSREEEDRGSREEEEEDRGSREEKEEDRGSREEKEEDRGSREEKEEDRGSREEKEEDRGSREEKEEDRGSREEEEEDRGSREEEEEDRGSREEEEEKGSRGEEDKGSREEEGQSLPPPPSKEDSVTEEKEMEESNLESGGGDSSVPSKLNNTRLELVSVPFGGARPKQAVTLKLQIPWSLSGQVQNQLSPTVNTTTTTAVCKNHDNRAGDITMDTGTVVARGDPGGCVEVVNGELLNGSPSSSSGLVLGSESSPDNDLQAGYHHQGALPRKQLSSLGEVAPVWVPDSQAPVCMKCEVRFTFTKRRHHCRACGKVFCAACCSLRSRLIYMDRKEARVCITCHSALLSAHSWGGMCGGSNQSPNPNNPAQYCSTIPPLQQIQTSGALDSLPHTVPVGVLKTPGSEGSKVFHPRERRRVWFADGILPNGEAAESPKLPATSPAPSQTLAVSQCSNKSLASDLREASSPAPAATVGSPVGSSISLIPEDGLPPILISTGVKGAPPSDYKVEERPSETLLMQQLEEGGPDPLVFVLNANLLAMVKLVNYVNRKCWYVTTKGMHAVGQAEVVVLLQCLPDEKSIPKDLFSHFVQLYQEALTGNVLTHLGHSFFTQSFLGSREHGGFLYVTPSFQSLQDLMLPNPPYLFGVLLQKWETPWAKMFPIRLMLRLGAEYRFYPCPLFSVRFRKPLFGETGHTIMTLLVDFCNYQYTLSMVKGLVVDMEVKKTCIKIPSNRYNELMKAMNKSNEHVLAMGACFNEQADSHLVCIQNDDGNYQTQAISIHHQPRKVTGACFFVFSGSLKAASGYLAKTSIVEDGVMVQITAETMDALRQALRDMKDFSITCGWADQEDSQEHVHIQWIDDDHNFFNKGVISPIDGKSMEFITSVKIFHGSEFKANGKVIRWTEVFFLQSDDQDQPNGLSDPADHSRLTENVARAFCVALGPHLKRLKEDGMAKLGLRVTLESDQVGYLAGSNGQPLLSHYLSDLDSTLIPVIHRGACQLSEGPVVMELVFYILEILS